MSSKTFFRWPKYKDTQALIKALTEPGILKAPDYSYLQKPGKPGSELLRIQHAVQFAADKRGQAVASEGRDVPGHPKKVYFDTVVHDLVNDIKVDIDGIHELKDIATKSNVVWYFSKGKSGYWDATLVNSTTGAGVAICMGPTGCSFKHIAPIGNFGQTDRNKDDAADAAAAPAADAPAAAEKKVTIDKAYRTAGWAPFPDTKPALGATVDELTAYQKGVVMQALSDLLVLQVMTGYNWDFNTCRGMTVRTRLIQKTGAKYPEFYKDYASLDPSVPEKVAACVFKHKQALLDVFHEWRYNVMYNFGKDDDNESNAAGTAANAPVNELDVKIATEYDDASHFQRSKARFQVKRMVMVSPYGGVVAQKEILCKPYRVYMLNKETGNFDTYVSESLDVQRKLFSGDATITSVEVVQPTIKLNMECNQKKYDFHATHQLLESFVYHLGQPAGAVMHTQSAHVQGINVKDLFAEDEDDDTPSLADDDKKQTEEELQKQRDEEDLKAAAALDPLMSDDAAPPFPLAQEMPSSSSPSRKRKDPPPSAEPEKHVEKRRATRTAVAALHK
jgi:hypothetical protein